jgi:hypothetical protein
MSKNTLLFFEPYNENFFSAVIDAYKFGLRNILLKDAETYGALFCDAPIDTKTQKIIANYYDQLPFPSCRYIIVLNCDGRLCGKKIKVVLTHQQEKRLRASVKKTIDELESSDSKYKAFFTKLKMKCPWYDNILGRSIRINDKYSRNRDKFLDIYISGINTRSKPEYNAKKFVFAYAAGNYSEYLYVKTRTTLKPFAPCKKF